MSKQLPTAHLVDNLWSYVTFSLVDMELYNFIYLPFGTGQVAYSWLIKAWECKRGESKSEAGLLLIICEVITMSRTYFLPGDE